MPSCLIGLGSNLGDRSKALDESVTRLRRHPSLEVTGQSPWLKTAAVGGPAGQPPFLNGALVLETSLPPHDLLTLLQAIEADMGRQRQQHWGPRIIDLDLLLYEERVLDTPALVLPHPRMAWRRFVLQPAAMVAGAMIHPTIGWSVARLLKHLDTAVPYVAITGPIAAGKSELARRLAAQTGGRLIAEPLDLDALEAFYHEPDSRAFAMELQLLEVRTRLLAAAAPQWSAAPQPTPAGHDEPLLRPAPPGRPAISDFWFDQSLAFAAVWLPAEQFDRFRCVWEQSRERVVQPKLIVALDAPEDELLRRVLARGRRCEGSLSAAQLRRIRQAVLTQTGAADLGPVLRITRGHPDDLFAEALSAIEAMQ